MIPINTKMSEALRYYRNLVTDDDIIDAIEIAEEITDTIQTSLGTTDPEEISVLIDQYQNDREELQDYQDYDIKGLQQFYDDVKRAYEDRHGLVYDTPIEKLSQWVSEDINNAVDDDAIVIENVDKKLLYKQYLSLCNLVSEDLNEEYKETLEGLINMLENCEGLHK